MHDIVDNVGYFSILEYKFNIASLLVGSNWREAISFDDHHYYNASVFDDTVVACGSIMRQNSGVIRSPNYPDNYPDNSYCTWTIEATGGTIDVQFSAFSIQGAAGSCDNEYVEVGYSGTIHLRLKIGVDIANDF